VCSVSSSLPMLVVFPILLRRPPTPTLFPYTTLFRSTGLDYSGKEEGNYSLSFNDVLGGSQSTFTPMQMAEAYSTLGNGGTYNERSEEHTSELQSRFDVVCRLLLEKKKNNFGTLDLED